MQQQQYEQAIRHLQKATQMNPDYSAAWKLYAGTLANNKQKEAAMDAYQAGIDAATRNGDIQAEKEMRIFLRRLSKV